MTLPMDSDGKATELHPFSLTATPHRLAFHLSCLSLFACFFSIHSPPPSSPLFTTLSPSPTPTHPSPSLPPSLQSSSPASSSARPRTSSAHGSLSTAPFVFELSAVRSHEAFIVDSSSGSRLRGLCPTNAG
ncbi:hypothetical protein QJS04_geneDACA010936 [Acorus gramineus]|uniref:Uncharacterized protein n=1 Tax=Acorus gramineus TaxID=55184 RepID=A0AAV9BI46_ACOGR|nr:hypothetical protein QJS04_geneDACA010936 [Acorus gramineus]